MLNHFKTTKPAVCLGMLIIFFLSPACKKSAPVIFSGQLLLTRKYPFALANRKIDLYQPGSASAIGINTGSTSSSSTSATDANGHFRISFKPGTSSFIIFSGPSSGSMILSNPAGDTSFPNFSRRNFPDSGYNPAMPLFIGKTIDTAIIKVSMVTDLTAADTIGLRAYTTGGSLERQYTGRSAPAGSVITLDTLSNMLFTDFDCLENKFINTLYAGRKRTTVWGYSTISSEGIVSPYQLSASDETKKEMLFYFKK